MLGQAPEDIVDRRTFVKGAVVAAAGGLALGGGLALARPAVPLRPDAGPPVEYYGLHRVGGPAPRGVPLIPIAVGPDGALHGRPDVTGPDGASVLLWYRYCGHAGAPGLAEDFVGDDVLRYHVSAKAAGRNTVPYAARAGEPIRADDLAPGEGAAFTWRSAGAQGADVLHGVVVRAAPGDLERAPPRWLPPARPLRAADVERVRAEFLVDSDAGTLVAASTFCTHLCCVPGFREDANAADFVDAANGGSGWGKLFCSCHNSIYHPFQIARYVFRPDVAAI